MLDNLLTPTHLLLVLFVLPLFFLPTIIAARRHAKHYSWIALANVVAGGTGLGWIVVLIWSLNAQPLIVANGSKS